MPKCARMVPTISDATATLTSVRRRPSSIQASSLPGLPPAPDSRCRDDSRSAGGRPCGGSGPALAGGGRDRRLGAAGGGRSAGRAPSAPRRGSCGRAPRRAAARPRPSGGSGSPGRAGDRRRPRCRCTTKGSSKATSFGPLSRLAVPLRSRSRVGNRGRAGERDAHRRAVDARVFDRHRAVGDLEHDVELARTACGRCGRRRRPTAGAAPAGAAPARH